MTELKEHELYEHQRILADAGQQLLRIDRFLYDRLPGVSRTRIANAIKAEAVTVNGTNIKPSYKIKPGDVISVVLPYPKTEFEVIPENIPLDIVYEDDDLIVVNKEAGMVVHPGHGNFRGTLVNALMHHISSLPGKEDRPGLVHRLDKDTSGLIVAAKNEFALSHLAKQFFHHTVDRKYIALVWGDFEENSGRIQGHIGRSPRNRTLMTVFRDAASGKHAVTNYRVIERFNYVTLIECKLETGRTHQIRVHLKHTGHAVFGDAQYGGDRILKGTTFNKYNQFVRNCFALMNRQALHAKSLIFEHPGTGKPMAFTSELPEDMKQLIQRWRQYTGNRKTGV